MSAFLFILILLLINYNQILSIKVGKIQYLSIKTNSFYQTSNINCTNCLCDCLNPSSILFCSGINCFPSNQSCQLIQQQQLWILESDILINLTSNNFVIIKENTSRLCSCYTPDIIFDYYEQINSTNNLTTNNIHSIKYISNDTSLIVLNSTLIRKLSANNLNIILNSLLVITDKATSILYNNTKIYISFTNNRSINMFDLNLTFIQTSVSWTNQVDLFGGMFLWNNQILIMDRGNSVIWLINSLNENNLTIFFNFSSYNIPYPFDLFIYQNQTLYISSVSNNLYLFDLTRFLFKQIITLSINISIISMRYDSNCDRLWFGTQNYTYAPVLDLSSNQMNIYQTNGIISKSGIYSIDFDLNYTVFFVDTNGNLHQIYFPYNNYC